MLQCNVQHNVQWSHSSWVIGLWVKKLFIHVVSMFTLVLDSHPYIYIYIYIYIYFYFYNENFKILIVFGFGCLKTSVFDTIGVYISCKNHPTCVDMD
jgi:hypothetical protein